MAARARRTSAAHGTDIAEQFFKEAGFPAQCPRLVAFRADLHNIFKPTLVHRDHTAGIVKPDVEYRLGSRPRVAEGELFCIAREIIPVIVAELAGKGGTTKCSLNGFPVVDPGLDRTDQLRIANIALMAAKLRATLRQQRNPCEHDNLGRRGNSGLGHILAFGVFVGIAIASLRRNGNIPREMNR